MAGVSHYCSYLRVYTHRLGDLPGSDRKLLPPTPCATVQASAEHHNASAVPFRIFGNTTVAQNGTAAFTGLVVNGKPGDTVTLTFRTQVSH